MVWKNSKYVFFLKIWGCEACVKKMESEKPTPKSDKEKKNTTSTIIAATHGAFSEINQSLKEALRVVYL